MSKTNEAERDEGLGARILASAATFPSERANFWTSVDLPFLDEEGWPEWFRASAGWSEWLSEREGLPEWLLEHG